MQKERRQCKVVGGRLRGKLGGGRWVGGNEEGVGNRPRKFIDKGQLITDHLHLKLKYRTPRD